MNEKKYFSIEEIKRKLEGYCVYQDRCHKEIETKLKEFILIEEARNQIILHLLEHNFLNEERFSKSFARGKFRIKKWGKQRIVRELKQRDVSAYNIKTALKEIDEDAYLVTVVEITEKRNQLIREPNIYKRKKKLSDFLIRKGYEYDLIFKTIDAVLSKS
jgi:regulatory protein